MDILVSQLSREDLGGHFLPHQHASKISQPQDSERVCNMFDKPCYLQYRWNDNNKTSVSQHSDSKEEIWDQIQMWMKKTTLSGPWKHLIWADCHRLIHSRKKNKTTQLEYQQCSLRKKKTAAIPKKQTNKNKSTTITWTTAIIVIV